MAKLEKAKVAEMAVDLEASQGEGAPARLEVAARTPALYVAVTKFGLLGLWGILVLVFGIIEPSSFLTASDFQSMFSSQAALIVLALALVPTLTVGELDLSIAGTMTLGATVVGELNGVDHLPVVAAVAAGLGAGLVVGLVNALLIVRMQVQGIVVTLGMATLLVGLSVGLSDSQTIGGVSIGFGNVLNDTGAGLSVAFYVAMAVALALWYLYRHTVTGRRAVYIGETTTGARLTGISVGRIKTSAFLVGALLAALSGAMTVGIAGGLEPDSLQTLLLPAFAGAFLGSTAIDPGRVNVIGTVVAILFIITGITGFELLGVSNWVSDVFYGGSLIGAVVLSGAVRSVITRSLTARGRQG